MQGVSNKREVAVLPVRATSMAKNVRAKKSILIDFNSTEEDRDKDSVRLALQKHATLFRYLFDKATSK